MSKEVCVKESAPCFRQHCAVHVQCTVLYAELGTRQYCCDNVTMFSGHKVVCLSNITVFCVATASRHRDLNIFRICSGPWGSFTLSRCRYREAIQLSRGCVNCTCMYVRSTVNKHLKNVVAVLPSTLGILLEIIFSFTYIYICIYVLYSTV